MPSRRKLTYLANIVEAVGSGILASETKPGHPAATNYSSKSASAFSRSVSRPLVSDLAVRIDNSSKAKRIR